MKVLVTGGEGMLGRAIGRALGDDAVLLGRGECDVRDVRLVGELMSQVGPDTVVHAAAWTDVDACEDDEMRARAINISGTQHVAMAAANRDARLIVISTDYVFAGDGDRPLTEEDPPGPRSVYGRTKLASEGAAIFHHPHALILRTSASYGPGGQHFPLAVAKRAEAGEPLRIVNDQFVSPTYVDDVAAVIARIVNRPWLSGVYHCANHGPVSWFDFAREVLVAIGKPDHPVEAMTSEDLDRAAPRPRYSALDSSRLELELGIKIRSWDAAIHGYVNDGGGVVT